MLKTKICQKLRKTTQRKNYICGCVILYPNIHFVISSEIRLTEGLIIFYGEDKYYIGQMKKERNILSRPIIDINAINRAIIILTLRKTLLLSTAHQTNKISRAGTIDYQFF